MKKLNENFKVASLSAQDQDVYHFVKSIEENVLSVVNSDEDTQEATKEAPHPQTKESPEEEGYNKNKGNPRERTSDPGPTQP